VTDLPVTHGLIRWWPNLFDARDEISGQEGVVMGVLPPVATGADDATEFGPTTAWVQLQPAITNEVFTFSFWVLCRSDRPAAWVHLLGQTSSEGEWLFQGDPGIKAVIGPNELDRTDQGEAVPMIQEAWQHVAISRRPDGTSQVWLDGRAALNGRRVHVWPRKSRWLMVGNALTGSDLPFFGGLRDLCAFDRVLTESEVRALHAAGLPRRPARNTAARLAATRRPLDITASTNVVTAAAQQWTHRRYTAEDGLPGTVAKAVLQARNGYLWVGTEEGLARFDGKKFQPFTAANTPAMRTIGQTVWSLAEDADGTIWAGIFGGLLRIRGLEFTAFTNGLPQRFVLQAQPAGDGSVWVAGFNNFVPRGPCWLRRYHPESGTTSAEVMAPGHVRQLIVATNGVWLATEQPQQMHFWDGRAAATTVMGTVLGQIDNMPPTVQIGTRPGTSAAPSIRMWKEGDKGTNSWAEVEMGGNAPVFHWLWDTRFRRPSVGRWNGPASPDKWLGVFYDLARLRDGVVEKIHFASHTSGGPEIASLCANREGGVWFATEEDGLHFLQERLIRVFTTQDGLSGNNVISVCPAPDGSLWVNTSTGLSQWSNGAWLSHDVGGRLRAITIDREGWAWFGRGSSGSDALGRKGYDSPCRSVYSGLDWQDPNSLRFARDGTLWVVCERGLTWLKPKRFIRDNDGNWVINPASTEPAVGRYSVGKELPKIFPTGLVEDRDGSIWMGSVAGGLFHVVNGRVENFTSKDGLPGDHCVPVYLDDTGALWITGEGGLTRRAGGRFQTVTEKDGLPKDVLLDLIEDDGGNFWISGKRGIHRVVRREAEEFFAGRVKRIDTLTLGTRDGLLTPECASLHYPSMARTPDGHIWVATRNGLATFDPRRVRMDTQPLPAVIEQLRVNRREWPLAAPRNASLQPARGRLETGVTGSTAAPAVVRRAPAPNATASDPDDAPKRTAAAPFAAPGPRALPTPTISTGAAEPALRLPPGSGERLEFHYTAISLVAADRVKFSCRLVGYDSDWSPETDLRLAFYTNLKPGAYEFRVKAANAHGVWSAEETTLPFVILPYFWQTAAFQAGAGMALLALAAGIHWRRLTAQRRMQDLKHQQVLTGEKSRIAADMHDELGAALTQIAILGEVAKSQASDETRSTLERISQSARDVTSRMSDLVWATNPLNDTLDNLVAYLREHAASQFENTRIQPHIEIPTSLPEGRVSATFRRNLLLVMKESLNNVIKHSNASEVAVRLEITGSNLVLRITDNGRGFAPGERHGTGNGLGNMRKRVRDLGGDFSLTSTPGEGTRIEASVPLVIHPT
jgi:signal transduction histidine kinase/ligand-binding sensor domain-containing protein